MFNFLKSILKNFILVYKNIHNFCLPWLNKLKDFLIDLDAKLSKKLIFLIDRHLARKRDNLLNWYIVRYLIITREIPKFIPWVYRLVEVRIPLVIVDPRNDLTIFWFLWFAGWNIWIIICNAFLIQVDPWFFAIYFVEYFVLKPPVAYYCTLGSQLTMYLSARLLFYIRRHKLFFVTTRERTKIFLRVFDVCFFCFFYYYMTTTMPALYQIEISYMLEHYF